MMSAKVKSEKGSAFILALMVVAAVGLLVTPVIYLATTGLRSTNLAQQRFLERYAADAGVEQAIWIIENDPNYLPVPGIPESFQTTFNNHLTDIEITLLDLPEPMEAPDLTDPVNEPGMSINKIVDPSFVYPCLLGNACPTETFTYTIFIENYGGSPLNLDRFGDCLPLDFLFDNDLQVTRVQGILAQNTGLPLDEDDLNDLQLGPAINDNDIDFPCPDGRQQVKWEFNSPRPFIAVGTRAEIEFQAKFQIGPPGIHDNEAWVNANPNSSAFEEPITMEEPVPVVVDFAKRDISSTAGGTTVNARTTVWEFPGGNKESYILSWQVE